MKAIKLSVAAVAALAVSAFAADGDALKPYGQITGEVGSYFVGNQTKNAISVKSYSSRFGLTGAHGLAGGLTAVYQVEVGFNPVNGQNGLAAGGVAANGGGITPATSYGQGDNDGEISNRNSYVGLAGGFGTVLIGNHDTPYKLAARGSGGISSADTISELRLMTDRRLQGAIAYVAPAAAIGGTTLALAIVPVVDSAGDEPNNGFHYSLGAIVPVEAAGLKIGLGYESAHVPAADEAVTSLFAGVNFATSGFSVGAYYEQIDASDVTKKAADIDDVTVTTILVPVTVSLSDGVFVNLAFRQVSFDEPKLGAAADAATGLALANAAGINLLGATDALGLPWDSDVTQISAQIGKNWGKDFMAYLGVKNTAAKNVDGNGLLGGNATKEAKKSATEFGVGMRVSF
ncbi:MAG: porin [Helicobacteraceae bacterium]|jgi:predicted porin|nr:porin [Helicobacteraceae bacterium]